MKRLLGTILFLLTIVIIILAGCTENNQSQNIEEVQQEQANRKTLTAEVTEVVDGDTIKVKFANGQNETIRLLLVDTPETKHPNIPVQPFGPEASAFAKETLAGQTVEIELDVSERDKYGRLLAYIWIGDRMFNEMLLEKGLARVAYVYPPNVKYVDLFRTIQAEAQENGIGIWSIENYAQEDGYHHEIVTEPTNMQTASSASEPLTSDCVPIIKGNINSAGEKIFHVPGGQFYDVTKPEEMFCTEEEAIAAGFRKSKR